MTWEELKEEAKRWGIITTMLFIQMASNLVGLKTMGIYSRVMARQHTMMLRLLLAEPQTKCLP